MNQRRKLLAALAAAALAAPSTVLAQGTGGTIVIGQSAPLSGSNKDLGTDIRNGALAYFKRVNDAGGVNGRKIELVTLDDANDTKRAEANTKQLLEQNNPIAIYGYGSATLSRPALPLVEAAKVAFVAPFTGADPMRKFNRYVYNHRASYADELEKIVEHYTTFGVKRFVVVYYDDAVGKENFGAVERALKARNLTPVATAAVTRTQTDFAKELGAVGKSAPDVVILTTLYRTSADFIKGMKKQGVGAQFVSTSFAGSTALAHSLGADGLGVAMSQVVPSYLKRSVPVVKEYQAAMEAAFGKKEFSYTSLESYIAAKVLVEGLRRAGPNPTREKLLAALDTVSNYDVGGYLVSFSPTNHNGSSFVSLSILGRDLAFKE
ncbi:MAG TPA: ABC transporter substrate-binding protein [Burkholderiales bacterium]|nr:ABC transporter substrate-binding protein [Burkholderiales bacterium]